MSDEILASGLICKTYGRLLLYQDLRDESHKFGNKCFTMLLYGHPCRREGQLKDDFPMAGRPTSEMRIWVARAYTGNRPTMPILRLLLGLPRIVFFS